MQVCILFFLIAALFCAFLVFLNGLADRKCMCALRCFLRKRKQMVRKLSITTEEDCTEDCIQFLRANPYVLRVMLSSTLRECMEISNAIFVFVALENLRN